MSSYYGYFYHKDDPEGLANEFGYSTDLESLKRDLSKERESADPEVVENEEDQETPAVKEVGLSDSMKRALEVGLSQHHLISVTTMMRPALVRSMVKVEVVRPIIEGSPFIEESNGCKIFGLTEEGFLQLDDTTRRLGHLRDGLAALPSAVLMSLVATFDSFIADLVRQMLRLRPERYANSDRTILIKDVIAMKSFDDFMAAVVEEEAYLFSRGSHDEQVRFIEKNLHVPIIKHWKRWPDFIEVFERRNLIAHGETTFNSRYVAICKGAGHSGSEKLEGQEVKLSRKYLNQAADLLLEFSLLLVFVLWRKHFEEDDAAAFEHLNETVFQLISQGRHKVATLVIEFALSLKNSKMTELSRRMLTVNLASAYKHMGDEDRCKQTLEAEDWSASSDAFRICVASLNSDVDVVVGLMATVASSDAVQKSSFRRWPVFKFVRDERAFQDKFEEIYKEPLRQRKQYNNEADASGAELHDNSSSGSDPSDGTIH